MVSTPGRRRFDPHPDFGAARNSLAELTLYDAGSFIVGIGPERRSQLQFEWFPAQIG